MYQFKYITKYNFKEAKLFNLSHVYNEYISVILENNYIIDNWLSISLYEMLVDKVFLIYIMSSLYDYIL